MKNYLLALLFTGFFILNNSPVSAHESVVTIDYVGGLEVVDGVTPIVVPSLPFTLDVEGTVSHDKNLSNLWLWATDNDEYFFEPERIFNKADSSPAPYTILWPILHAGQHVITIDATHKIDDAKCKAAPAIATDYLRGVGLKNNQDGESVIGYVAKATGKDGEFWAKEKCQNDYEDRTVTFVLDILEE